MGAWEAAYILDTLQEYGALTERTVRQYVVHALTYGPEIMEGTRAYDDLLRAVLRDARQTSGTEYAGEHHRGNRPQDEQSIGYETAGYLREILTEACGDRSYLRGMPFDGFSEEAYEEVRSLLGAVGMEYLGISGRWNTLRPDPVRVIDLLEEEWYTREQRTAEQKEAEEAIFPFPDGLMPPVPTEYPEPLPDNPLQEPQLDPLAGLSYAPGRYQG